MTKPQALTAGEHAVMDMTLRAAMLRAAAIIDRITPGDLLDAQREMLRRGEPLEKVSRMDRAMLAAAHFRAIADGEVKP